MTSAWLLVALCAATGAYCLLRLRSSSEEQRSAAGSEALMGFGMAAMAVPAAVAAPPDRFWVVLSAVFCGAALRALWLSRRSTHHLHHLVGSLAMVYMAVAMVPEGGHTGHGAAVASGGVPLLTGLLLAYYGVYVLRTGARLLPVTGAATAGAGAGGGAGMTGSVRPEVTSACRLAMGIGMLAMLLTL